MAKKRRIAQLAKRLRVVVVAVGIPLLVACNAERSTDRLLAEVWASDQQARHQVQELTRAVGVEGKVDLLDSLVEQIHRVERIDQENMSVVDSLLQHGLPSGLSPDSYKTIWLVIDHASLERQAYHLPLIEQMACEGLIDEDAYATLFDRVAMKQHRPQRYGTQSVQFGAPGKMQLYLWPVESAAQLDSLRASVGLSPVAEYLQQLTETSGIRAHYLPQLTVDEIEQLRQAVGN